MSIWVSKVATVDHHAVIVTVTIIDHVIVEAEDTGTFMVIQHWKIIAKNSDRDHDHVTIVVNIVIDHHHHTAVDHHLHTNENVDHDHN